MHCNKDKPRHSDSGGEVAPDVERTIESSGIDMSRQRFYVIGIPARIKNFIFLVMLLICQPWGFCQCSDNKLMPEIFISGNAHEESIGVSIAFDSRTQHWAIASVYPNSSAEQVGLKDGDIIEKINTKALEFAPDEDKIESIARMLRAPAGTTLELSLLRSNQKITVKVPTKKLDLQKLPEQIIEDALATNANKLKAATQLIALGAWYAHQNDWNKAALLFSESLTLASQVSKPDKLWLFKVTTITTASLLKAGSIEDAKKNTSKVISLAALIFKTDPEWTIKELELLIFLYKKKELYREAKNLYIYTIELVNTLPEAELKNQLISKLAHYKVELDDLLSISLLCGSSSTISENLDQVKLLNSFDEQIKFMKPLTEKYPTVEEYWQWLANAYWSSGNANAAIACYKQLVVLNDTNKSYRIMLNRMVKHEATVAEAKLESEELRRMHPIICPTGDISKLKPLANIGQYYIAVQSEVYELISSISGQLRGTQYVKVLLDESGRVLEVESMDITEGHNEISQKIEKLLTGKTLRPFPANFLKQQKRLEFTF